MEKTTGIPYKWLALLTVSIGTFMGTLDFSIVNVSFPKLTKVFETDILTVSWVSIAPLLVSTSLMLIVGRIGDAFGRKKIYIVGSVLFTIGLVFCSLSQSIFHLILSRIVMGLANAMMIGIGAAIITEAFPDRERGKALGIQGAIVSAGLLTGPALGGFLLDILGLRAIFFTRLPIGIIGLIMTWFLLKEQRGSAINSKFDLWGAVTLFGGISCMLLFFNPGLKSGFESAPALIMAASAILLLSLFVVQELKTEDPLVDLNLFRNHIFASGNISLYIMALSISAQMLLMPFYLIDGAGYSAMEAGLFLAITSSISLVVGPTSGWLSDKIGSRILCTLGAALICLSLFLFSGLDNESSNADILFRFIISGIGIGLFFSPNTSSIMGAAPKDRLGTASAMVNTIRQLGFSSGIAIVGLIFTARQLFYADKLSHDNLTSHMLHKLSLIGGYQDTFLIASIVCSIGIITSLIRFKKELDNKNHRQIS
ncbi:MFS transporter [Thermodesulfobacteriota bacterium]